MRYNDSGHGTIPCGKTAPSGPAGCLQFSARRAAWLLPESQTNPRTAVRCSYARARSSARNDIYSEESIILRYCSIFPFLRNPPPPPLTLEQIQIQTALEDQQRARDKHELEMRVMEAQLNGQAVQGVATQQGLAEEDDFGESSLSPAQRQQLSLFPGQHKKDVIAIIKGTFLPRNLPHLDRNATAEAEPDYALVAASDGRLLQQKTTAKISSFGGTPKIWSKTFLIYAQILCVFFSTQFPTLIVPLLSFHARVLELADTYKWQDGVLNWL